VLNFSAAKKTSDDFVGYLMQQLVFCQLDSEFTTLFTSLIGLIDVFIDRTEAKVRSQASRQKLKFEIFRHEASLRGFIFASLSFSE
jgi:hypothetical protein